MLLKYGMEAGPDFEKHCTRLTNFKFTVTKPAKTVSFFKKNIKNVLFTCHHPRSKGDLGPHQWSVFLPGLF